MHRVLITDDSDFVKGPLKKALEQDGYEVFLAADGVECLQAIEKHAPELLILDLMLPKLHGIEILKQLKQNPKTQGIGVIVATGKALYQDYQMALDHGANHYLIKPVDLSAFLHIVKQYFQGSLRPNSFPGHGDQQERFYSPSPFTQSYMKFWGTRGSITVSGGEFLRYGGNTPCLEICHGNEQIIIDAGTGIRPLGHRLKVGSKRKLHLFIGHTHWDHINGFPFFSPAFDPGFDLDIYGPQGFGKSLKDLLGGILERDYFPVRLEEMQAKMHFHVLTGESPVSVGEVKIFTAYATHPGATLCFKVEFPHATVGYATDNEFLLGYHGHPNLIELEHPKCTPYLPLVEFFKGCDLLIHEAQYTPEQYRQKVGWGHSSISNAATLIKLCGIKHWIITHHDPDDTDDILQKKFVMARYILKECNIDCQVEFAFDGYTLPL